MCAEGRISKHYDRTIESIESEEQKEKRKKERETVPSGSCGTLTSALWEFLWKKKEGRGKEEYPKK